MQKLKICAIGGTLVALLTLGLSSAVNAQTRIRYALAETDNPVAEVQGAKSFKEYVEFKSGG